MTRVLLLPALISLLVASGCFAPGDGPKPDELPQAPPPREKKTTAELLVGTWKFVKQTPNHTVPGWQATFEFKPDGTVTLWKDCPVDGDSLERGTYRVVDDSLRMAMDTDPHDRKVTIRSITDDTLLVASDIGAREPQIDEYRRVRDK